MSADVVIRCAAVALGGAIGSLARYGLSLWGASLDTRLPWGTFAANALGCLVMGAVMYLVVERQTMPEGLRLLLAVGLLGGLTTFSTFSYEAFALLRQGHTGPAGLYLVGSLLVGLGGAAAGWWLAGLAAPRG
jgi:CrcB protein